MAKKGGFLHFLFDLKTSGWQVMVFIMSVAIMLGVYNFAFPALSFPEQWSLWLEAAILGISILIGVAIWLNDRRTDWVNSLPARLNVHFLHNGKYVLSCYWAVLTNEADIRHWGQQIGSQMNKKENLHLEPIFRVLTNGKPIGGTYKLYEIEFYLSKCPGEVEKTENGKDVVVKGDARLKDSYLVWVIGEKAGKPIKLLCWNDTQPDVPFSESAALALLEQESLH